MKIYISCIYMRTYTIPPLYLALFLCPDVYRIWDEPPKVSFLTAIRGLAPFFLLCHSCVLCSMCWFPNAWICNHVALAACQRQYLIEPDQSIDPAHSHFRSPPCSYLSILPANNFPLHIFNHPSCVFFPSVQHSNPGHAGPFPVASLHNANPTSPTSASMAGAHAHRSPASPIISPIELIPSVTNPENLPCLPDIPPIQVRIF